MIFPAAGLILSVLTCIIKGNFGADTAADLIGYFIAFTLFSVIGYLLFIVVLSLFVNTEKPCEKFNKFYNGVAVLTLKLVLEACNVKVTVEGIEKIPADRRFVLIQNHRSMFDPIVSVACLGKFELGFITKPENTHLPVIGRFMHNLCCIPIDRENPRNAVKSITSAAELVKTGVCSVAIYPEGTRSKGEEMLSFKNGSLKIATKSGAPLVITTVDNTDKVRKNAPFKRTNVVLKICEVIPAEEVSSSSTAELADRAQELMYSALGLSSEK